jgi:NTF2-related export protein 1/2
MAPKLPEMGRSGTVMNDGSKLRSHLQKTERRAEVEARASAEGKKQKKKSSENLPTPSRETLRATLLEAVERRSGGEFKIANESKAAAEGFADLFYLAINKHDALFSFYATNSKFYREAGLTAEATINGQLLPSDAETSPAVAYEELLRKQRINPATGHPSGKVVYEVHNVDVQVLNPDYTFACPESVARAHKDSSGNTPAGAEPAMQLLVQIGGSITFGAGKSARRKGFSESVVLIPNWETYRKGGSRYAKRYLIQSQNFRSL